MPKRFQTYFEVPIPPFKEEKLGAGSTTIRFVITGKIPSKKNNSMAVTIRKPARSYLNNVSKNGMVTLKQAQAAISRTSSKVRGNREYQQWVKEQKPIMLKQMNEWSKRLSSKGLVFPLTKATMSVRFYFNNNYSIDSINKGQSVQDLLVDCNVIQDDNYNVLNPIHYASANYKDELIYSICFVSISFKI
jgi:hypothetical protein